MNKLNSVKIVEACRKGSNAEKRKFLWRVAPADHERWRPKSAIDQCVESQLNMAFIQTAKYLFDALPVRFG